MQIITGLWLAILPPHTNYPPYLRGKSSKRIKFAVSIFRMGQLAIIKMFLIVSIPTDINDNRRHVHIFKKGGRHIHSLAKIWIERNGVKDIEIAESYLSAKDNAMIVNAIDRHWDFINQQITKSFNGEKTVVKNIEK